MSPVASNWKVVDLTPVGRTQNFFFQVYLCHSLKNIILIYSPGLTYTVTFITLYTCQIDVCHKYMYLKCINILTTYSRDPHHEQSW